MVTIKMDLVADCIVCLNEKQCIKPCSCTARVCVACVVRMCASDADSHMKCPQCRTKIDKEEFGIPKLDLELTQFVTSTFLRSSMIINRPPLAEINFEDVTPLRIDDLQFASEFADVPRGPRVCVVCNSIIREYEREAGNITSGVCSTCYDEINRDREIVSSLNES